MAAEAEEVIVSTVEAECVAGSSELGMVEAVEAVVAEPEPMLTPLPAAQFAQRVGELLEALEAAVRELSAGGYENFAEQVGHARRHAGAGGS
eukprot:scaffold262000_cov23-Tisochrysis_lutea.AAC.1